MKVKVRKEINYYNMLGLHPDIDSSTDGYIELRIKYLKGLSDKDIKIAYRNLSKIHHPDKNKGDDSKFKEIAEAYNILSNDDTRDEYDSTSKHGINYETLSELYEFEFSNENVSGEKFEKDYDKYKKKELINILLEIDEFQSVIEYDRYVSCNHCDCTGVNPELVDMFDCDVCDGVGKDRFEKKCIFCDGKGKLSLGFDKCPICIGEKIILKKETINIKLKDFVDNKLILQFKGNASKYEVGKLGNLYIKIKE